MTTNAWVQIGLYLGVLLACVKPLGLYMARIYQGRPGLAGKLLSPLERLTYRLCGIDSKSEMTWQQYAGAVLSLSFVSFVAVYLIQRLQGSLPLNPQALSAVSPDSSFNTAISFVTNTNWQGYGGETTMSYFTQMMALSVQNFVSAATGMAILIAMTRGFTRNSAGTIGNFWIDLIRSILYILLPLSMILAIVLASQGVVQTFSQYRSVSLLEAASDAEANTMTSQTIALGPAASQIAIKQLGTNGGGFFNVNSAHPLENPHRFPTSSRCFPSC